MGDIVRLNIAGSQQELRVKEYRDRRVVTLRDVDEQHRRPEGTARKRFNDNRNHFVEGEDFFEITQPSEIRTLGLERPQGGVPEKVVLLTESGYLMLAKSLTDDLAWDVQRQLVNGYFRAKTVASFDIPQTYAEALRLAANLWEKTEEQEAALAVMAPKADFYDSVGSSKDTHSIRDVAKVLGTGQNRLFAWLRGNHILMGDNRPYQQYLDQDYFVVVERTFTDWAGNQHLATQTRVTGKGLIWLQKRFRADQPATQEAMN